jgi:hypothetical protein
VRHVLDEIVEEAPSTSRTRMRRHACGLPPADQRFRRVASGDDSGLADAMQRGIVYSDSIDLQLRRLQGALRRIDENAPVAQVLGSGDLATVRSRARELLEELRNFEYDGTEQS